MDAPSYEELRLAVEALAALVRDEFPAEPLADTAFYHGTGLTERHLRALRVVEESLGVTS